ncbi:phytanoyl-CoA dioxygenase family protein [Paenibacillus eucommiae]|uniref:Phytanoyl-CoA hydroxylase n=1 Tax=Paenibacillus eucommiae TaxID=1355755 RepID=A0ABS4J9U8_9BACL|nr:phytanoyl-CoA dioxygenase family protein [Paenibacillus eucommiae]MBP1996621.1 phytanoyl-CoA hydroxylase [Paenibacillus eucommiae]
MTTRKARNLSYNDYESNPDLKPVPQEIAEDIARRYYRYDRLATERINRSENFVEKHISFYKDQGYVVVDQLLSQTEVDGALEEISDIIQKKLAGPKIQFFKPENEHWTAEERELAVRKIYNYVQFAPKLNAIAYHPAILHIVEQLLGDNAVLVGEQGLLKPPHGGGEKPWHQDMAYGGLFYKKQIVTVWIALDEANLDNGCMHIIPRSHLAGGVPHFLVRDWQMCDSHVDVEKDMAVCLQPGGALFFSGLLQHGTPANFSALKRRALQFRYAPASSELMSKEQFKLMFTGEIMDAEC